MNFFPQGVWRYASLLLVLLVLAAVASYTTVAFLAYHPELQDAKGALSIVSLMLLSLSMGFLFLSGALGLWGLRHVAELESRRRIGLLVDRMDYVAEGVLVVDPAGHVVGSNPAARFLAGQSMEGGLDLQTVFPQVGARDLALLGDRSHPHEVEVPVACGQDQRTLRFRSEPAQGVSRILITDVTEEHAKVLRVRQAAHFQMVGRVARGVAHDFNTVLCAISGHAALLGKAEWAAEAREESIRAIVDEARRGEQLARRLVDLSRTGSGGATVDRMDQHVDQAAGMLRMALPEPWEVETETAYLCPPLSVSGRQVEQILLNLGLLVAEAQGPGTIYLQARPGFQSGAAEPGPAQAVELHVGAAKPGERPDLSENLSFETPGEECGVILSVLRTLVEDAGGQLALSQTSSRYPVYRVVLPGRTAVADEAVSGSLPKELSAYVSRWTVLLACPRYAARMNLERKLRAIDVVVETAEDQVSALACVEDTRRTFSGVVLDQDMLAGETEAVLRALLKLQGGAGLVVFAESGQWIPAPLRDEVVWVSPSAGEDAAIEALIKAREAASRRQTAA